MDEEKVTSTPADEVEQPVEEPAAPETASAEAVAEPASPHKGFFGKMDNYFGITKRGSSYKKEIIAGITTFMAMVYILMVNANFFALGIPVGKPEGSITYEQAYGAAYIATAIGAIAGTMLMAFLAKMPLAQASGMGVNAFIVFTLINFGATGLTYANTMMFTLLDGVIFIILTATGLRKKIFDAIPKAVRHAIPVGIGLFIAFIGMQNAKVINANGSTLVEFVSFNVLGGHAFVTNSDGTIGGMLPAIVALVGVLAIAIMAKKNVKGAILWGILGSAALFYILMGFGCIGGGEDLVSYTFTAKDAETIAGVFEGQAVSQMPYADFVAAYGEGLNVSHFFTNSVAAKAFFESISISNPFSAFGEWGKHSVGAVFYEGFSFAGYQGNVGGLILLIVTTALSLYMIDMFDTIGTLYGACSKGNLLDENGVPLNMNKMMLADAIGTCVGAVAGTSTVTTFVESSAGVSAGGKTGFTAFVTGLCFLVAMFLSPIAQLIPSAATAAALIWVGVLMMTSVTKIDWADPAEAIVAFLTFIVMVLGYSISKGIGIGIIAFVLVKLCTGKVKEISIPTWVISVLFLATFLVSSM